MKRILIVAALAALFAVPADSVAGEGKGEDGKCSYSAQECLDHMATRFKNTGWVGVELEGVEAGGMAILTVIEGSPAEEAGIQVGDVLMAINGIELSEANHDKLETAQADWKPGTSVKWSMVRAGEERDVPISLGKMPADLLAKYIGNHMLDHAAVEPTS